MILTKQSFEDYQNYVEGVKAEYERKDISYNWKFATFFENIEDVTIYYFSNRFETVKIMYIHSAKITSVNTMYNKDLEIINQMQEGLK